ncbi:cytochrome P450 [Verminephrobacter aporrectodeae]|uniref:cytochrome P450 n=1 Tax=Verminephrobacter aporrectodeae TaxID=1110389 RepID=UPI00224390BD|nr:cytochrome P450 [Verminephrobacter aporrectodeae]MCW8176337.1 cytochrome P450 [Verminephrobacter aporrectodeae subsp. tuberculatae]MCW8204016.1 cytochrome P450 [Verminephrobacter aporrectodeae subsp. tuberculatae]
MTNETKGGAPLDAPTHPDPYNYYAQLHSAAPVQFDAALNAWVVSSAAAVTQVLENPVARVRPATEPVPPGLLGSQAGLLFRHLVRMNDGPVHERLKCQIARCLDAVSDETLWEIAREAARQCATLTEPVRHPDGLTSFCYQLPAQTMGLLLGLPAAALPRAARLTSLLVRCISPGSSTADQLNASREAAGLLWQLFDELLDDGVPDGRLGLLWTLQHAARDDGGGTMREAVIANAIGFMTQAFEATAGLIGNAWLALAAGADAPDTRDAQATAAFLREVLRHDPPIHNTRRFAAEDFELDGSTVRAGESLLLLLAAANRDPTLHAQPERFDPSRGPRHAVHLRPWAPRLSGPAHGVGHHRRGAGATERRGPGSARRAAAGAVPPLTERACA